MIPINILLVEDDPNDIELTLEAFKTSAFQHNIYVVQDGIAAMAFLRNEGEYKNVPRPDIVLLDLNLPKKDGASVLLDMRMDSQFLTLPVIVLSTSDDTKDISSSYRQHANCYITKPLSFEKFLKVVKAIEAFWLNVVKLPDRKGGEL